MALCIGMLHVQFFFWIWHKFIQYPQAPGEGRYMESNCGWILEARLAKGCPVGLR
jgi:hypothetical protein